MRMLDTEIEKALGFEPELKLLIFATTANKDAYAVLQWLIIMAYYQCFMT